MATADDRFNEAIQKAREIAEKAQNEERPLTADEQTEIKAKMTDADAAKVEIKAKAASDATLSRLGAYGRERAERDREAEQGGGESAASLGDHYAKHASDRLKSSRGARFSIGAPEWKADHPITTTGLTEVIQQGPTQLLPLRRPTVASLLLSGSMSGTTLQYFVEGAVTGAPTTVAENALKPEMYGTFTAVTETLAKIAGWTKESDELIEDYPALVSIINGRLTSRLSIVEENELLSADGTGTHIKGLLNRTGVQTVTGRGVVGIFNAMTAIQQATYVPADWVVVNPVDYERERLATDANKQYFGGGPFMGQYGVGGVPMNPPIWGLQTVVTSAITAGTALVGTRTAAQVFRKGGVRVDATNTDQDDFVNNRITVRIEERLLLAVYQPTAFCTVTMTPAA